MNDFYGRLFHSLPGLACVFDCTTLKLSDCNDNFVEQFKINRSSLSTLSVNDILCDSKYVQFVLNNSNDRNYCEMDEMLSGLVEGETF